MLVYHFGPRNASRVESASHASERSSTWGIDRELGQENAMLKWAIIFAVVAIIAGLLGFSGLAGVASGIAKVLFFLFLVIMLALLVLGFGIVKTVKR
jgi:uncharacterized membrane protein YtjA (UPF0391 family)